MPSNFSIYNRSNGSSHFPKAAEEVKVEITFKDEQGTDLFGLNQDKTFGTVVGYLSKEFEYNATGNYTNIFEDKFGDSLLYKLIEDESQRNIMNYGYLTKKMYKNGDSPVIDISFRCYGGDMNSKHSTHYNYIQHPIAVANALVNATLPRVGENALLNFTDLGDSTGGRAAFSVVKTVGAGLTNLASLVGIPGTGNLDQANENSNQAVDNMMMNTAKLMDSITNIKLSDLVSKKPPVCLVKIGNFFEKDMMVVKSVSVKISKEFISKGLPLYADFDVSLQSLFNSATMNSKDTENEKIFGSGLNVKNSTSRVSFDA